MPDDTMSKEVVGATTVTRRFKDCTFSRPVGKEINLVMTFEEVRTADLDGSVISIKTISPPLVVTGERLQEILPAFGLPSATALRDGFVDLAASEWKTQNGII